MSVLDLVLIVARLLIGCWLLWRLPLPKPSYQNRPACAVIVPARDEALVLATTLAAVLPQIRAGDELVVVDDHSTDGTRQIAADAGVRVVVAPPLDDGWTGKCSACWTGASATSAPVLCFLDADTRLAPGMLDRLVCEVADGRVMASAQPWHEVVTLVERASAFFNLLALMATGLATPTAERREQRAAFGPVLLARRAEYEEIGGHRAVAGDVLDDLALAARWRDSGRSVRLFAGRSVATFRMYPHGWRQLVQGWTKNIATGAGAVRRVDVLLAVAWLTLHVQATWWVARTLGGASRAELVFAVGLYLITAVQLWWMLWRIGSFGWVTAALFPVPLLIFLAVFARSLVLVALGRPVPWKGRRVQIRRPRVSAQPASGGAGDSAEDDDAGTNSRSR